jgi:hypothetical protein
MVSLVRRLRVLFMIRFEQGERVRRVRTDKKAHSKPAGERVALVVEPTPARSGKRLSFQQEEFAFVEAKGTFHLPPASLLDSPEL